MRQNKIFPYFLSISGCHYLNSLVKSYKWQSYKASAQKNRIILNIYDAFVVQTDINSNLNKKYIKPKKMSKDKTPTKKSSSKSSQKSIQKCDSNLNTSPQLLVTPRKLMYRQQIASILTKNLQLSPQQPIYFPFKVDCLSPYVNKFSMMIIQTPYHKNNLMFELIGKDDHINIEPITQKKMNFQEDLQNSQDQDNQSRPDQQQDSDEEHQSEHDSKEFQHEEQNQQSHTPEFDGKRQKYGTLQYETDKEETAAKSMPCNCKKTQCLKLYCDCFRQGKVCGPTCNCIGCHNLEQFEVQRVKTKQMLNKRNPEAFKPKIQAEMHAKGCNCKRTKCLKKYCECYQAGLKCGQHCKCEGCENCSTHQSFQKDLDQKIVLTVKKDRRMRQLA